MARRVKGTAVAASARFVEEKFGQAGLTRLLAALPAEDRALFDAGILASAWYSVDLLLRFMQEGERQLGGSDPKFIQNMGRASAEYGLTTVYRIFFKVGTPEFIIARAAKIYGSYYDSGKLVIDAQPGRAVAEIPGFEGAAPQYCARIYGWMTRILELTGARNLRTKHTLCIHRGDALCRWEGFWEP